MLTELSSDAVLLTVTEISDRHGVSKQATSRRVKRLVNQHDLAVERDAAGRIVKVDVAAYENLIGYVGDQSKARAKADPKPIAEGSLDAIRLDDAKVMLRRRQLDLSLQLGKTVPVDRLESAIDAAGGEIASVLNQLPNATDDLAAAFTESGVQGLRKALQKLARDTRRQVGEAMAVIAADAPETEAEADIAA